MFRPVAPVYKFFKDRLKGPLREASEAREHAARRRDELLTEGITGWATNLLFPIPDVPDCYDRLPWRRIFRIHGAIRGVFFIAAILAKWPFELSWELLRISFGHEKLLGKHMGGEVSRFSHGDHVCFLYRTEDALLKMLVPYVLEGLKRNERCLCVEAPDIREKLCYELRSLGVDIEQEIGRQALMFQTEEEAYFRDGNFDPKVLLNGLELLIAGSLEAEFTGFRVAGEVSKAACDPVLQRQLLDYEARVDDYFLDKKATAFCHYRLDQFPRDILGLVIDAHGCHIADAASVAIA